MTETTQVTPELAQTIITHVEQHGLDSNTVTQLRQTYPDLHFTHCMDDDINHPNPVLNGNGFNLYLVGGGHCLALTQDYAMASGFVLAEIVDENE